MYGLTPTVSRAVHDEPVDTSSLLRLVLSKQPSSLKLPPSSRMPKIYETREARREGRNYPSAHE